jgi:basic membrane lipoprotein Med (substrate-binding protein (PBP1-ABC) superfamily)
MHDILESVQAELITLAKQNPDIQFVLVSAVAMEEDRPTASNINTLWATLYEARSARLLTSHIAE